METVHLTYRDNVTGRVTRSEVYYTPRPYGWRAYARDVVIGVFIALCLAAFGLGAAIWVLLTGALM